MMTSALKLAYVTVCGLMPLNALRVFFYRLVPGYRIGRGAKIGFCSIIHVKKLRMGKNATIKGVCNIALKIGELTMDDYAKIGSPLLGFNFMTGHGSTFTIGQGARITWGHFFDLSDDITIGAMTIIGGKSCEFFTHDMYNGRRTAPIRIGSRCYVGSSSKFAMGAVVPDDSVVAMGSVVSRAFDGTDCLIGGVPARVVKEAYGYDAHKTYDALGLPYSRERND